MRLPMLSLALAAPLCAQFAGLATPADGARVYFVTALRQKYTGQPAWGKLFVADSAGLRVQEIRPYEIPDPPRPGYAVGAFLAQPTNAYDIVAASVSGDGKALAVAGRRDCIRGGNYCSKIENYLTTIAGVEQDGNLRLSASGEWAFGSSSHGTAEDFPDLAYLVNRKTGKIATLSDRVGTRVRVTTTGRPVANDGTAVFAVDTYLGVWRDGNLQRYPVADQGGAADVMIDAAGKTVIYSVCPQIFGQSPCSTPVARSVRVADAGTGESRLLAAEGDALGISDDGRTVLYRAARQLRLVGADGSGDRRLTNDPTGITTAILSGDGNVVYAVTGAGRLIRVDTATGAVREIVPGALTYGSMVSLVAPGKVVTIPGTGFSEETAAAAPPLPYTLAGVSVQVDGVPARVLAVAPDAVTIVAPPVIPVNTAKIRVDVATASSFEAPADLVAHTATFQPEFLFSDAGLSVILTAHQDWSGLVTVASPARPGEVVHSYGVGWGPTAPAVPYGLPAPASAPLARFTAAGYCAAIGNNSGSIIAETPYQGLAPGLAGIYQIDWRVPDGLGETLAYVYCAGNGGSADGRLPVAAK